MYRILHYGSNKKRKLMFDQMFQSHFCLQQLTVQLRICARFLEEGVLKTALHKGHGLKKYFYCWEILTLFQALYFLYLLMDLGHKQ